MSAKECALAVVLCFRFQKDTWVLFVDFVKAFDTVPREMLFKVIARLGFPPKIVNLVRVFHENVTLEVDLDDDGNTISSSMTSGSSKVTRSLRYSSCATFKRCWRLSFPSSRLPALRS